MTGLTATDLVILKSYVKQGNRELYWNYLSQLPGADGYGTLALGVVRNDSLPGQVANSYARDYARRQGDHGSQHPNAILSERQWELFGQTLIKHDLDRRMLWMDQQRADLALNLPGNDVMTSHDEAFLMHGLDPNCWTPRKLLTAAKARGGPQRVEEIWTQLLNNNYGGLARARAVSRDAMAEMGTVEGAKYLATLGLLEAMQVVEGRDIVNPDVIGSRNHFAVYAGSNRTWTHVMIVDGQPHMWQEKNPARIDELEQTRLLRMERQRKATEFHDQDTYRTITRSPLTVSADAPPHTSSAPTRLADIGPDHPDHALLQQIRRGVADIDASLGRPHDTHSERLIASVLTLARRNNFNRVDHVVLSIQTDQLQAGHNVIVVEGAYNNPAHRRAVLSTDVAMRTSVEESLRELEQLEVLRHQRQQTRARDLHQPSDGRQQDYVLS